MPGIRELLAVALGVLLGGALLLAPRTAVRLSVLSGSHRHRGEYGTDGDVPERWVWLARALGVACVAVAALVAYQAYG